MSAKVSAFALLTFLAAASSGWSQAVSGTIVGTVSDASGAAVPNAKVVITDMGRDITQNTTTNESGNFTQRFLIVGRYRVRVEAGGFKAFVQENIPVSVDTELRVDAKLQIGEMNQTVEVTSEAGILKTERSDVAATYTERTVTELPVLSRRFTNFQLMTPGVVAWPVSLTAASAENPQGSYRMLVNGQSFAGTSHLLDGTDNHDAVLGWIVINPTLESVTEAKITTANYDAEFGVASAGVVSAQTKAGTNQLHGSVFEFLRNDHMIARNPFTQSKPIPNSNGRLIPLTQWNQFGASIGGAAIKNKLFYFGDYQGTRRNTGGGALLRVPSDLERTGDLSATGINIFDPLTGAPAARTQFPGNRIPASRLSAQTQNLLKLIPAANTSAALDQPNFASSGGVRFNDDAFNVRVDHYTTDKIHVFGRYSMQDFGMVAPGSFGLVAGGPGLDSSGSTNAYAGASDSRTTPSPAASTTTLSPPSSPISASATCAITSSASPTASALHPPRTPAFPASMWTLISTPACPLSSSTATATTYSDSAMPSASMAVTARSSRMRISISSLTTGRRFRAITPSNSAPISGALTTFGCPATAIAPAS